VEDDVRGSGTETAMNAPEWNAMTDCPELEDLAALHDGRLTEADRARVLEHVATCGNCSDILVGLDAYAVEEKPNVVKGRFGWKVWLPAAAVAAMLVITFGALFRERLFAPRDPMREVVVAAGEMKKRPVEGRLSGDFTYKKHSRPRGGARVEVDEIEVDDNYAVQIAAPDIVERSDKNPTPKNLHATGVLYLLLKEHKEEALPILIRASNDDPRNAALLSDLAAAYIDQQEYEKALVAAQNAEAIERSPAAVWNRALALDWLGRKPEAIAAWEAYLALDSTSGWAEEARGKLRDLRLQ
jgi:Putative zinc-finger